MLDDRLLAEPDQTGHWFAWLASAPQETFGGATLAAAVGRLLMAQRWNPGMLEHESSAGQRRVFRVRRLSPASPD